MQRLSLAILLSLLTIWSVSCSSVFVPPDSCVGLKKMDVGERLVVGSVAYGELFTAGVSLFDYPGSVLTWDLAKQIKDHNDFVDENCTN